MKRIFNVILSVFVSLTIMVQPMSQVYSDTGDIDNLFTDVVMKLGGPEGTDINPGDRIEINEDTRLFLNFKWELDDSHPLKDGDKYYYTLPSALKGVGNFESPTDLIDESRPENDRVIGSFIIDENNQLIVTFNDRLAELKERAGELGLSFQFNLDEFTEDAIQIIDLGISNKTLTAVNKPEGNHVKKSGTALPPANPTYIEWKVDVNKNLDVLKNVKFSDQLPAGVELNEDSIKVYELTLGSNGEVHGEPKLIDSLPKNVEYDKNTNKLGFDLEDIDRAYRIVYETIITDFDVDSYKNSAAITSDTDDTLRTDSTEVGKIESNPVFEKEAIDPEGKSPEFLWWHIDVNKSELDLKNVVVSDIIPEGLEFEELEVWTLNYSNENFVDGAKLEDDNYSSTYLSINGDRKLEVVLGDIDSAYRIKVKTKVDYDGDYFLNKEFTNKAYLSSDTVVSEKEDTITIENNPLLTKTGAESSDYETNKIKWTVEVNEANHFIKDAIVTDKLSKGLEYIENTFKLEKFENGAWIEITDKEPEYNDNAFTLSLGDINEKYRITYETKITKVVDGGIYTNSVGLKGAGLSGDGIGTDGSTTDLDVPVTPSFENSYSKDFANETVDDIEYNGIDYKNKTISFKITIDAKKEAIKNLILEDYFYPEKSLVFLKDTLKVINNKNEDVLYTLTSSSNKGFTLEFGELPKGVYHVYYKASFDVNDLIKEYNDASAKVKNGKNIVKITGETIDVEGKHKPIDKDPIEKEFTFHDDYLKNGFKVGDLNRDERYIDWKIYVNAQGKKYTEDYIITDTMIKELKLVTDSITVHKYALPENLTNHSQIIIGEEVETGFKIDPKTKDGFTLTFKNGIEESYVISYKTTIHGKSLESYNNSATVTDTDGYSDEVHYEKYNKFVDKNSDVKNNEVYVDSEVNWTLKINESLSDLKNVKLVDTIEGNQVFLNGSLTIEDANGDDVTDSFKDETTLPTKESQVLKIDFGDIDAAMYTVTYKTVVIGAGEVSNTAEVTSEEVTDAISDESYTATQTSWGSGSGKYPGNLTIQKLKEDKTPLTNNSAKFTVEYKLNDDWIEMGGSPFTTNSNGIIELKNIPVREYRITEFEAPTGFEKVENSKKVDLSKESDNSYVYKLENEKIKISKEALKTWINGETLKKPTIKLALERKVGTGNYVLVKSSIKEFDTELNKDTITANWSELDKTDDFGKEYTYRVVELDDKDKALIDGSIHSENYKVSYDKEDLMKLTNTYVPSLISVSAIKKWEHGTTLTRPVVKLQLRRTIEEEPEFDDYLIVEDEEVKIAGDVSVVWDNLPETDDQGVPYKYLVVELDEDNEVFIDANYDSATTNIDYDFVITNTFKPTLGKIEATKVWENGEELSKPNIFFKLYRTISDEFDFKESDVVDVKLLEIETSDGENTVTVFWDNLPLTDIEGNEYNYYVQEVDENDKEFVPENYTESYDQLTVTNTYESPTKDFVVTKTWDGGSIKDQDHDLELQLLRNGEEYEDIKILKSGEASAVWEDLDITDIDGVDYEYTVIEVNVPENYEVSYDGLDIVNTYISPKTEFTVEKEWINGPKDRPTIEVQLYRDGEAYGEVVTLENGVTEYTWDNLDLTDHKGVEYVYSVDEVSIPENYDKVVEGNTITNDYVIPKVDITVEKLWINGPEERPTIEVQLYRDGKVYGEVITLENGTATYTWSNLDKTDIDGNEYVYTVDEVNVPENYEKLVDGDTIINTYVIPKTSVSVKKLWDGEKADSVIINLYADDKFVQNVVLNDTNNWEYTFKDLDKTTLDGTEVTYTVEEAKIEGYDVEIKGDSKEGFTVINTQITDVDAGKLPKDDSGTIDSKLPLTGSVSLGYLALVSLTVSALFFGFNRKNKRKDYFD